MRFKIIVFVFLFLFSLLFCFFIPHEKNTSSRYIRYSFTLENLSNAVFDDVGLTIYTPLESSQQNVKKLISSHGTNTIISQYASKLDFKTGLIPPYSSTLISVDADLALKQCKSFSFFESKELFLKPEKYIPSDDPEIKMLINQLVGKTRKETVNNIMNWIRAEIRFTGYSGRRLGAKAAINNKYGDCTELMDVFLALARASSIPCRGISGFICDADMILKPDGYHNWAEYHDGISWIGVDPSYGKKDDELSDYIAFRIFEPGYEGDGSLFEIPERFKGYIKVRMNT